VSVFVATPYALRINQHGDIFIVNTGKDKAKEIHLSILSEEARTAG
jgi:hypothetical protein